MKKIIILLLGLTVLSSCMLKSEHDASLAGYKKRADVADQTQQKNIDLQQKVSQLEQDLSDLSLRNQDLSNLNQQLVEKNRQLTDANLSHNSRSLDDLKKAQLSKQVYLSVYDKLSTSLKSTGNLMLKDEYVGIVLHHDQLFKGAKPNLSAQGQDLITTILQALPAPHTFSVVVEFSDTQRPIKKSLEKTYSSQMSLRAFEASQIADAFKIKHEVTQISALTHINTQTPLNTRDSNASYTIKLIHLP